MKTPMTKNYELKVAKRNSEFEQVKITTSKDGADFMRKFWAGDIEIFESFFLLTLNRNNMTTGYVKISQGGVAGTVVDVKIIAKYAVDCLASAVIIAHNHPSGNLKPSEADKKITTQVKAALQLLDITLLDHIILTADSYLSFADEIGL